MKYINRNGINLSRFQLGTVQLGMTYGLGEDREKPSEEKALALLDRAAALGINTLDTANNYGDAERVIGKWLKRRKETDLPAPWVVTKIGPLAHGSYDILRDDVLRQTEECLKTLGVEQIDCLMLHVFEDYEGDRDGIRKIFEEMKREGLYQTSALSAYSRHDYKVIAESGFDAVQIPLNVFDWGQIENGGMEALARSGMAVFVRSVFLQGLVFHTPEDLDPRMDFCVPYLKKYLSLCREFELAPDTLALSYVLSVPGVKCAVLGCDNVSQLESNCALIDRTVELEPKQIELLRDAFAVIDPRVINPGLWFNHT